MVEHDARAHEKQRIAMDRMKQKHAREVKLALEKDRIERDGELRSQTRIARQASASESRGGAYCSNRGIGLGGEEEQCDSENDPGGKETGRRGQTDMVRLRT